MSFLIDGFRSTLEGDTDPLSSAGLSSLRDLRSVIIFLLPITNGLMLSSYRFLVSEAMAWCFSRMKSLKVRLDKGESKRIHYMNLLKFSSLSTLKLICASLFDALRPISLVIRLYLEIITLIGSTSSTMRFHCSRCLEFKNANLLSFSFLNRLNVVKKPKVERENKKGKLLVSKSRRVSMKIT